MSDYTDTFDKEIRNKVMNNLIFMKSEICDEKQNCYYHNISKDCSFKIGEILRAHLPFAVYSEVEYMELYKNGVFHNIDKIITHIKANRLPERKGPKNGIYSETLLDMLIMFEYPGIKKACIRTIHRQRSDNNEIKGFDSIHMLFHNDEIILLLGQAKLGDRDYCIRGIKDDIKKLNFMYTYDEMAFVADKRSAVCLEVRELLSEMNMLFINNSNETISVKQTVFNNFFSLKHIKIMIPCLLAYEKSDLYLGDFDAKYISEINSIMKSVKDIQGEINFSTDLFFMFFPVFSKTELRNGMNIDE